MKRILAILFSLHALVGVGQDTTTHYTYGTSGDEDCTNGFLMNDQIYLFGSSGKIGTGDADIYAVLLDSNFNVIKTGTIGSISTDRLVDAHLNLDDSTFILISTSYNGFDGTGYNIRLDIIDAELNSLNHAVQNVQGTQTATSVVAVGGSIFTLHTDIGSDHSFQSLQRLNQDLTVLDEFQMDTSESNTYNLLFASDTSIFVGGTHYSEDSNSMNIQLLEFDLALNQMHEMSFGTSEDDDISHVFAVDTGDLIITGSTFGLTEAKNNSNLLISKVDWKDSVIWQQVHGNIFDSLKLDDFGVESFVDSNDRIYAGMISNAYGAGATDFHIYNLSSTGNFSQGNSFGQKRNDDLKGMFRFQDHLVMYGNTNSFGRGQRDFYVVKAQNLDQGAAQVYIEFADSLNDQPLPVVEPYKFEFEVHNTNEGELYLSSTNHMTLEVLLFDLEGRLQYSRFHKTSDSGVEILADLVPAGNENIYVLHIRDPQGDGIIRRCVRVR